MKKRAVVGVGVAGFPEKAAGNSWAFLQWGLGLRELGWEVWLVESLRGEELKNRQGERTHLADSVNLIHWKQILREIGWDERATLLVEGEKVDEKGLRHFAEGADLFLNLSGHFKRPDLVEKVASRVYVDLDPAFTQIWAKVYQSPMNFSGHNAFWSVGLGMGRGAVVPDTGHTWKAVVPPVCRKYWTREAMGSVRGKASELSQDHWTTVAHWYGYATVEWEGRSYSNKAPEFEILRDWPKRSGVTPRVVTDLGVGEERSSFEKAGWQFVDPLLVCSDWQEYRAFLATSRGEFSPAKGGYVTAKTGWFSDRSVLYLSLGRPVLLQETGWSKWLPEGMGLVTFRSLEEAVEKVKLIEKDYGAHCAGAEKVAAEFLDARRSIPQALAWL